MSLADLPRIAHTVECFLNALRLEDSRARTEIEEWLSKWLAAESGPKLRHVVYSRSNIYCYADGKIVHSFSLPTTTEIRSLWCDGQKISIIDGDAYQNGGKLVMLGLGGLILTLPGAAAAAGTPRAKEQRSSNNNNNNNNNNNG